jgi:hypothetical protein
MGHPFGPTATENQTDFGSFYILFFLGLQYKNYGYTDQEQ